MEITVNGEARQMEANITIGRLIDELGFDPKTVAVLVNDDIVERARFDTTRIQATDAVELVRFVPGG